MLGLLATLAFLAVGTAVSLRLLALWRRTRQLPELTAALGLFGIGPLGFCLLMLGITLFADTPFGRSLRIAGLGIQALGFASAAVFTWRVFRPGSRAARAAALAIGVSLVALWAPVPFHLSPRPGPLSLPMHVSQWIKIATLLWGAVESLRYWSIARQRVRIGFADPVVSAGFLLWGVALISAAVGFVLIYAILELRPGSLVGDAAGISLSTCGLVTAAALYLGFLPPQAYARWVAARAPAPPGRS